VSAGAPLRFGVVGTGLIAGFTAGAITEAEGAVAVAVSSRRQDKADEFARDHGLARALDDWRALVALRDIDAVYVATPTAAREAVCLAAAQAGKHVLADKPFADAASVARIVAACRAAGVAFMDCTHFTHHPRTALLRATLAERIGRVQGVRASFFFPNSDRSNIRFDPAAEPTGAIGDMAWYCMRALIEYAEPARLQAASGHVLDDEVSGTAVRGAGVIALDSAGGAITCTWDAGYTSGACAMDLHLLGERGEIWLDDFVLDWPQAFPAPAAAGAVAGFHQRSGVCGPPGFVWHPVPGGKRQIVRMVEHFVGLAGDPRSAAAAAAVERCERTQALLDAAWTGLRRL
jgi:predicted dehydrogenase